MMIQFVPFWITLVFINESFVSTGVERLGRKVKKFWELSWYLVLCCYFMLFNPKKNAKLQITPSKPTFDLNYIYILRYIYPYGVLRHDRSKMTSQHHGLGFLPWKCCLPVTETQIQRDGVSYITQQRNQSCLTCVMKWEQQKRSHTLQAIYIIFKIRSVIFLINLPEKTCSHVEQQILHNNRFGFCHKSKNKYKWLCPNKSAVWWIMLTSARTWQK